MSHGHEARVTWERGDAVFTDRRYDRAHTWTFDGGVTVPASSSPAVVRPPMSREDAVDPEEAYVAALSSCHMLFFLDFASRAGFVVDRYDDRALGTLEKGADGRAWMSRVALRPAISFSGERKPTAAEIDALHHRAHEACFIANSVRTEVTVEAAP